MFPFTELLWNHGLKVTPLKCDWNLPFMLKLSSWGTILAYLNFVLFHWFLTQHPSRCRLEPEPPPALSWVKALDPN